MKQPEGAMSLHARFLAFGVHKPIAKLEFPLLPPGSQKVVAKLLLQRVFNIFGQPLATMVARQVHASEKARRQPIVSASEPWSEQLF